MGKNGLNRQKKILQLRHACGRKIREEGESFIAVGGGGKGWGEGGPFTSLPVQPLNREG